VQGTSIITNKPQAPKLSKESKKSLHPNNHLLSIQNSKNPVVFLSIFFVTLMQRKSFALPTFLLSFVCYLIVFGRKKKKSVF
jgi:hypothetical protein